MSLTKFVGMDWIIYVEWGLVYSLVMMLWMCVSVAPADFTSLHVLLTPYLFLASLFISAFIGSASPGRKCCMMAGLVGSGVIVLELLTVIIYSVVALVNQGGVIDSQCVSDTPHSYYTKYKTYCNGVDAIFLLLLVYLLIFHTIGFTLLYKDFKGCSHDYDCDCDNNIDNNNNIHINNNCTQTDEEPNQNHTTLPIPLGKKMKASMA